MKFSSGKGGDCTILGVPHLDPWGHCSADHRWSGLKEGLRAGNWSHPHGTRGIWRSSTAPPPPVGNFKTTSQCHPGSSPSLPCPHPSWRPAQKCPSRPPHPQYDPMLSPSTSDTGPFGKVGKTPLHPLGEPLFLLSLTLSQQSPYPGTGRGRGIPQEHF